MNSDAPREFHLIYTLVARPEGIPADEVPEGSGACDRAVVINATKDGNSLSLCTVGLDGETGKPLPAREIFRMWLALANGFARNPGLLPIERAAAAAIAGTTPKTTKPKPA